ncbi:MAG: hypothetical protein KDM81_19480, partial [Verrucomicrobiae bacterium]|nr:hypothetical protein [Verrucomicrobiae bacterium]
LLRDEPISFRPEEGLELVVRGPRTERDRLIGDLGSYQPFRTSFNDLIGTFNRHAGEALDSLDRIESSVIEAGRLLARVRELLDGVEEERGVLRAAEQDDGLFAVPELFEQLLPMAEASLAQARGRAGVDPVGTLEHEGRLAARQAEDSLRLAGIAVEARSKKLDLGREAAAAIDATGLNPAWVEEEFNRLSTRANEVVQVALDGPATAALDELEHALTGLVAGARQCADLAQGRRELLDASIPQTAREVAQAREALGAAVNLPAAAMLHELEADPDAFIRGATEQLSAAAALLEKGDGGSAAAAVAAAREHLARVEAILSASRQAAAAHAQNQTRLTEERARLEARLPEARTTLEAIRCGYDVAVLRLGAGDPTHPEANGTVDDNLREAEEHLAAAKHLIGEAREDFHEGRLLGAGD